MAKIKEGSVVICATGQAGTVVDDSIDTNICVLLRNSDLWFGPAYQCRLPQSKEDLDACPLDVDRFEERERTPRKRREQD